MRKLSRHLAAFSILSACLTPVFAQNWPISEGARKQWQAVGRVTVEGYDKSLCTGTLIAPDKVLTAAHCVTNGQTHLPLPFYRLTFTAGWHKGDHAGAAHAADITIHPDYAAAAREPARRLDRFASDLALITLATPLSDLAPIAPLASPAAPGPVAVLGYSHDRLDVLTDYIGCQAATVDARFLGLTCAPVGGTSGGPVFFETPEGWRLAGVVVASTGQGARGIGGLAVPANLLQLTETFGPVLP